MEESIHSDDELIALGKKIVLELKYDNSVDTLGKWMSHYIAELMLDIEECEVEEEKKIKKKECFDVILKLWKHRYQVPFIEAPLDDLKPLLKVLDSIKKREGTHWSNIWPAYDSPNEKDSWGSYINITKQRYETILELVLLVAANKTSLKKIEEWTENFETLLTEDEQALIKRVKFLLLKGEDFLTSLENRSSVEENITYEDVMNKVKAKIKLEIEQMLLDLDKLSSE